MNIRQYITIMLIATVLCWTAWGFVVVNVDPFFANALSFAFFYLSLFLALLGTLSIIIFLLYYEFSRAQLPLFRYVQRSFRSAMLIAFILTLTLFFQGKGWLTIWNATIFVLSASLIGVLIASIGKGQNNNIIQA